MSQLIVVNLKARLQPIHRHNLEDAFLADCEENQIKLDIVGGGTLMNQDNGEPLECDIEIAGIDDYQITGSDVGYVAQFFEEVFAPKGSSLKVYKDNDDEPIIIAIGNLEGLVLILNGTDLPDEVYQNHDINVVIDECIDRMKNGDIGRMHSYHENEHTHLYFYGANFDEMKDAILPFLNEHPLCQNFIIDQIA